MSKQVEITFKIDGIEYTIDQLNELKDAAKETGEASKKASKEAAEQQGFFSRKIDEAKEKFGQLKASVKDAFGIFGKLSKGIAGVAKGFGMSSKAANIFGKVTSTAIAATGIGLLVPLVLSLVNYFKNLEGGAKALKKVMAGLGAIISNAGKALSLLVKGNFKEAFLTMKDAVNEATTAVDSLFEAEKKLSDFRKDAIVQNAELTQSIEANKKVLEDSTLAANERLEALDKITAATKQLQENQIKETQLALQAAQAQLTLANNYEERREKQQEIAELQASLIDQETQLQNIEYDAQKVAREIRAQEKAEREAEAEERRKANEERIANEQSVLDKLEALRIANIKDEALKLSEEFRLKREAAEEELRLKGATEEQIAELNSYYDQLELEAQNALEAQKKQAQAAADAEQVAANKAKNDQIKAQNEEARQAELAAIAATGQAIGAIGDLAGEGTLIQKAAGVAQATINTYLGASQVLADEQLPSALKPFLIAAAIATGLKQVQEISKVEAPKFALGGPIIGPSHSRGGVHIEAEGGEYIINKAAMGVPGVAQMASALNSVARPKYANGGMVGADAQNLQNMLMAPIKTYVVATEMTNSQEANRNIERQARL